MKIKRGVGGWAFFDTIKMYALWFILYKFNSGSTTRHRKISEILLINVRCNHMRKVC